MVLAYISQISLNAVLQLGKDMGQMVFHDACSIVVLESLSRAMEGVNNEKFLYSRA